MEMTRLRRWDSAEHLKTGADMAGYLDACLEEAEPALISHALGTIACARGMDQLAADRDLAGQCGAGFAALMAVVRALGLRLRVEPDEHE